MLVVSTSTRQTKKRDYLDMFDGKEEVTLVVVNVTAEHTVDDTIHFYPDQGTLVTNTGEQIDAAL